MTYYRDKSVAPFDMFDAHPSFWPLGLCIPPSASRLPHLHRDSLAIDDGVVVRLHVSNLGVRVALCVP